MLHIEPQLVVQKMPRKAVNEFHLIEEVKQRPELYDKTCKAYRKSIAMEGAWQDIARTLDVRAEDCKKRWKSLRDRFIKYYRLEVMGGVNSDDTRKNWDYYDQMSYLKGHVELFRLSDLDTDTNVERKRSTIIHHKGCNESVASGSAARYLTDEGALEIVEDSQNAFFYEDAVEGITTELKVEKTVDALTDSEVETLDDDESKERLTHDVTDPDERFLLSCAPVLKRLSRQKNALVRLKIQTLLYEIEFGEDASCDAKKRKSD